MTKKTVHRARSMEARFARLARDAPKMADRMASQGIGALERLLRIPGSGFQDKTGRLRRSLTTTITRRGHVHLAELTAKRHYARLVEYVPRIHDKRPGPPYWFGPALEALKRRAGPVLARSAEVTLTEALSHPS